MTSELPVSTPIDLDHPRAPQINAFLRGWESFCGASDRRVAAFQRLAEKMLRSNRCNPDKIYPPTANTYLNYQWGTLGCEIPKFLELFAASSMTNKPILSIIKIDKIRILFAAKGIQNDPETCTIGQDIELYLIDTRCVQMNLTQIREVPGMFIFFIVALDASGMCHSHYDLVTLSEFFQKYSDVEILALSY
jgi:hypothetical protein